MEYQNTIQFLSIQNNLRNELIMLIEKKYNVKNPDIIDFKSVSIESPMMVIRWNDPQITGTRVATFTLDNIESLVKNQAQNNFKTLHPEENKKIIVYGIQDNPIEGTMWYASDKSIVFCYDTEDGGLGSMFPDEFDGSERWEYVQE